MDYMLYVIQRVLDLWDLMTRYFNPEQLPMGAYIVCSALALGLWWFALGLVPPRLRRLLWAVAAAILVSPTVTAGANPQLAPANVGVLYGFATENPLLWQTNLMAIVFVFFAVLLLQQLWLQIQPYHAKPIETVERRTDGEPVERSEDLRS